MVKFVRFEDLAHLDNGMAGKTANKAIREAIQDLIDRGKDDGKSRKIVMELELYWHNGQIVANLASQAKLPPMRTSATRCAEKDEKGESVLVFRDDNPDNAEQPTFDDLGQGK